MNLLVKLKPRSRKFSISMGKRGGRGGKRVSIPTSIFPRDLMIDVIASRAAFGVEVVELVDSASTGLSALTTPRSQKPTNDTRSIMTSLVWSMRRKDKIFGMHCGEICPTASALPDQEVKHYLYSSC